MSLKNSRLIGIFYMLAAMLMFSSVNAIAKDTLSRYSLFQIIFFRNAFSLIPMAYLMMREGGLPILRTKHFPRYLAVGTIGTFTLMALFGSLRYLPLAEAVSIHFSEILILTALSALILKEHVGILRWSSIVIGFVGVLIIFRPTGDIFNIGAILGLAFAVGDAIYMLNARILTREDSSTTVVIYFVAIVSTISGCMLPWFWITPDFSDFLRLALLGLGGGIGQYWLTQAYRHAQAGVVAPMIYSALLWNILFGFLFWGDVPDLTLLAGATLIVGSGLFIIYREAIQHKAITAAPPTGVPDKER